jgi:hypothetical protein
VSLNLTPAKQSGAASFSVLCGKGETRISTSARHSLLKQDEVGRFSRLKCPPLKKTRVWQPSCFAPHVSDRKREPAAGRELGTPDDTKISERPVCPVLFPAKVTSRDKARMMVGYRTQESTYWSEEIQRLHSTRRRVPHVWQAPYED